MGWLKLFLWLALLCLAAPEHKANREAAPGFVFVALIAAYRAKPKPPAR